MFIGHRMESSLKPLAQDGSHIIRAEEEEDEEEMKKMKVGMACFFLPTTPKNAGDS